MVGVGVVVLLDVLVGMISGLCCVVCSFELLGCEVWVGYYQDLCSNVWLWVFLEFVLEWVELVV